MSARIPSPRRSSAEGDGTARLRTRLGSGRDAHDHAAALVPAFHAAMRVRDLLAFIGFADDGGRFMNGLNALGFSLTPKNFPLSTDNHLVLWELVKSGLGIGAIIDEVGDAEPLVERVFPELEPIPVPAWLVAHREVRTSRRVRAVWDLVLELFGPTSGGAEKDAGSKPRPAARRKRARRGARSR